MCMKMTDEKIDKLFEGMSKETARLVANQGCPKSKNVKKKKTTKGK